KAGAKVTATATDLGVTATTTFNPPLPKLSIDSVTTKAGSTTVSGKLSGTPNPAGMVIHINSAAGRTDTNAAKDGSFQATFRSIFTDGTASTVDWWGQKAEVKFK